MTATFRIALILALVGIQHALAQSSSIKGTVLDVANGAAIRGANIAIQGTIFGTMTDNNGSFFISAAVTPPFNVEISAAGYQTQRLSVASTAPLNVQLKRVGTAAAANKAPSEGTSIAQEYALKQAYLEKAIFYATWATPQPTENPFVIEIFNANPFDESLLKWEEKTFKGRKVTIRFVGSLDSLGTPDVLFLSENLLKRDALLDEVMAKMAGKPTLTVGDGEKFYNKGAVMSLFFVNESLRFSLNPSATKAANITFDKAFESLSFR